MTTNLFKDLQRPFPPNKISWRVGNTNAKKLGCKPWEATEGSVLAYIDARDVMTRLDNVMGVEGWQCRYPLSDSGLLICEIGLNIGRSVGFGEYKTATDEWVWKANGAGDTQVEAEKGKCSDAFKRAAVLWGIGRYLYSLPFSWVPIENGKPLTIPSLPVWATPDGYDKIMSKDKPEIELATDGQIALIQAYAYAGKMPKRTQAWFAKNKHRMTNKHVETIINECKDKE